MEITRNIKLAQAIRRCTCRPHEYHVYCDGDACVGGDTLYVWTTREYFVGQDESNRYHAKDTPPVWSIIRSTYRGQENIVFEDESRCYYAKDAACVGGNTSSVWTTAGHSG